MSKLYFPILLILCLLSSRLQAQFTDTFADGNITENPAWEGNLSDFIVNGDFRLQSNNTTANSTFYISTKNQLALKAEWSFWVQLAFNPSSVNYTDVYLTASASNLTLAGTTGYFVRIGGADDDICLYKKTANGSITKIIDGAKGLLNTSNNTVQIRVVRNEANEWSLWRDINGTGNSFVTEGSATDNTYTTSGYFGILIRQSTASFFQKHFFDNIEVKPYIPDVTPPAIVSAKAVANNRVDVLFNEPLDAPSASKTDHYFASNGLGLPVSAVVDPQNNALVHLAFSRPFDNGVNYSVIVDGVKDVSGNVLSGGSFQFSYYTAQRYDVLINEVFADPSPQVGLPALKFIELYNRSAYPINLQGWKLVSGSSVATLPAFNLLADSVVVITAVNSQSAYLPFGNVLGVSNFPSLNITGSSVELRTAEGMTMHAMQYDLTYYKNEVKKEGGWTLELIDPDNPCAGIENWTSSVHPSGGTPGKKNSVRGKITNDTEPEFRHGFVFESRVVDLFFSKTLDSLSASDPTKYSIDNGLTIQAVEVLPPFFNRVRVTFNQPVLENKVYTITTKDLRDCSGNQQKAAQSAKLGIATPAQKNDVVINEILFNPPPMGVDYVELYNRSDKIIDLSTMYLANRNTSKEVSSIQQISFENRILFPGEYVVLTTDPSIVKSQFITEDPKAFIQVASLPSYPNSSGYVIILNGQGEITDEVAYSEKWHFRLVKNPQGVALERISTDGPSDYTNFHSASKSSGYGTPGYKNSQHLAEAEMKGEITIVPEVFSPDNDGIDDLLTIHYEYPAAGYVTNITIFDGSGRVVRLLEKNSLSGLKGYFRWDGLDDKKRQLPQGVYIIYTEIFNLDGKKKVFKNSVVLARRVN